MTRRLLYAAARVVTCDPARTTADNPTGAIDGGAFVAEDDRIVWVGHRDEAPNDAALVELGDAVVTPGLVDAHTHAAWAGSRHAEYALKMRGADYREIAAAGGGIVSTHRAIGAISEDDLADTLCARLARMASLGVTTCEVKSGYGLTWPLEEKQLRAIERASREEKLPCVVPTFLGLHALPPDMKEKRDEYVERVVTTHLPIVARARLARFVDAYVDANAFTVAEARRLCEAARAAGLGVRLHVGQFADVGGAELAAELGARSADHLEHVSEAGARALAEKGVFCTLLPIASFTLRQEPPPVAMLRAAGAKLVVASDANPGTAPSESLPLAMSLAVRFYGLSPAEALVGATRHAAESLDEPERGVIAAGKYADFVSWDLAHEDAIVQPWGVPRARMVVRGGVPISASIGVLR
jgi:imidazolonepropionase